MMKIPLIVKTIVSIVAILTITIIAYTSLAAIDENGKLRMITFAFISLSLISLIAVIVAHRTRYQMFFLEGSLDAMEQPVTTTDLKMKWRFINKTTETLLAQHNLNKKNVRGKHCSNWKADICGTENCGVACLRSGKPRTHYNQNMPGGSTIYMQVDTNYIYDDMGRKIGHVEVVTNVETTSQLRKTSRILMPSSESMNAIASSLNESSEQMNSRTNDAVAFTESLSSNLEIVASSSSEMSGTVNSVASAIEEMSSTIEEISKNCVFASNITNEAEIVTQETQRTIDQLVESSNEIGNILSTIEEIAAQTNLLALNATIEAASAGEAGKGFNVVATEVKELAKQTASATEKISQQIGDIQSTTSKSSTAMSKISDVVGQINGATQTIASAIEEQSATVNELSQSISIASHSANSISENVIDASTKAKSVYSHINEIHLLAEKTASDANTSRKDAQEMAELSRNLTALVEAS
jgi:methyl-accepting chemotaxis protein